MSSWFGSWFGGGASAAKKSQASKEAILGLRRQLDMLRKREAHVEKQIADEEANARKYINTNKNAARAALKRKKQFEQNLAVTQQHINTLEIQMSTVENANINIETIRAMKQANEAMRGIHKGMGVNKIDDTMAEIQEGMVQAREISDAITQVPLTDGAELDDLDEELERMEQEALDNKMLGAPAAPVTATPGAGKVVQPVAANKQTEEDEEEAELRRLQAEMAM